MEIKNFKELIHSQLDKNNNKIISHEISNLLSAGENYGSIMLSIKIKLKNKNGEEEIKYLVAKIVPPSEFLWNFFNVSVTFQKEIGVYNVITPTLNKFGEEKGIKNLIHFFPDYYGSRISVNPNSNKVDSDAVLLLDNLKVKGFTSMDRCVGFNYELTKLLLKDLATLHASTIAIKLAKPEEFNNKIRPFLNRDFHFDTEEDQMRGFIDILKSEAAAENPECIQYFPKLEDRMLAMGSAFREPLDNQKQFATFVHGDLWVNNMLHKFENGVPVQNKIVDFQIMEYNSLTNDVLFLLYSSVELPVLQGRVDEFLKTYFSYFIETLKKLDCDTKVFTYEAFLKECADMARKLQFAHLCFMHIPMFTLKGKAKELTEWTTQDLVADKSTLHPIFGKRLQFIILDFVKRGWI